MTRAHEPPASVERAFTCAALTYQGQEPQDCNWPYCGCDAKATEVLQALDEHGYDPVDRHAKPASTQPARPGREEIARLIDPPAWQERERLLGRKAEWEERPKVGVDFVAIDQRDADQVVAPSLEKASQILALFDGASA